MAVAAPSRELPDTQLELQLDAWLEWLSLVVLPGVLDWTAPLEALSAGERRALYFTKVKGLTAVEAGRVMGCGEHTVRKSLWRGLRKLQEDVRG